MKKITEMRLENVLPTKFERADGFSIYKKASQKSKIPFTQILFLPFQVNADIPFKKCFYASFL
jgi:hypothetical protein